jgi:hypothetical protein
MLIDFRSPFRIWVGRRRWPRAIVASVTAMLAVMASASLIAQEEPVPKRVRVDHPTVVVTVMLGSLGTFKEVPTFDIMFRSPDSGAETIDVVTGVEATPTPTESLPIYLIDPASPDFARAIVLESCALDGGVPVDCRAVPVASRIPNSKKLLQLRLDQPLKWTKSLLRLRIPAGTFNLRNTATATDALPNPLVETVLPILGAKDLSYVESRPYFAFEITPVARDSSSPPDERPQEAAALDFRGGAFRSATESQWGVSWSGSIATAEEVSFNQLRALLQYERNLRSGDFLPAEAAFVTESDQNFDVVDTSLSVGLRYLLPVRVNGSPFTAFVPTTGPKVRMLAALGRRVRGAEDADKTFSRLGYDVAWRIPVSADAVIKIYHAGLWTWSDFESVADEFHDLWDLLLETKIGQLTYFVGYQRGEAAPLFRPINTTRAGLVVRFK